MGNKNDNGVKISPQKKYQLKNVGKYVANNARYNRKRKLMIQMLHEIANKEDIEAYIISHEGAFYHPITNNS